MIYITGQVRWKSQGVTSSQNVMNFGPQTA